MMNYELYRNTLHDDGLVTDFEFERLLHNAAALDDIIGADVSGGFRINTPDLILK